MRRFSSMPAWALAVLLAGSASAHAQGSKSPPGFGSYPAALPSGPPRDIAAEPILGSRKAKQYRSVIRAEFHRPANFAGHYRVAIWGCGTDCRDFAILDKKTGKVYTMPGVDEIAGVIGNDDERIDFRPDSRLLVISGCFNDDCIPDNTRNNPKAGKYHYLWNGKKLQWIHTSPLPGQPS